MGFVNDWLKPTTVTSRQTAHVKNGRKCAMAGCNRAPRKGHKTCTKPQHINAFEDFG